MGGSGSGGGCQGHAQNCVDARNLNYSGEAAATDHRPVPAPLLATPGSRARHWAFCSSVTNVHWDFANLSFAMMCSRRRPFVWGCIVLLPRHTHVHIHTHIQPVHPHTH